VKFAGRYVMVFRNDYGKAEDPLFAQKHGTNLGLAFSDDGISWNVEPKPIWSLDAVYEAAAPFFGGKVTEGEISAAYDPRLVVIEGRLYMPFALDTLHGTRGGIAVTDDLAHFEILSLTAPDNRNVVLFPERIGGRYYRLERPMTLTGAGPPRTYHVWMSSSPDLRDWSAPYMLLGAETVPFANDKIGPAAPPIRTKRGWLTLFHAVDIDPRRGRAGWETMWDMRYTVGIMLLDLDDPRKIVGISRSPLLVPEADYEASQGYRHNVIFPGGFILEDSGEVRIYYGASDTYECLATAHVDDLVGLCSERPEQVPWRRLVAPF
jgi:beta-1,4-mannooligosaccharide/beta-1,4-mannosyl-N-acetylglucosamine phosphorylase